MHKELLLDLGFSEAEIEEKDGVDVSALADTFRARTKELLKNDSEFTKEIITPERAKLQATYERKLKQQFDLTAEEIKDKNFEQLLEVVKEKTTKKTTAGTDEIQKELIEANKKIKQYEEEILPAKEQEKEEFKKQYAIESEFTKGIAEKADYFSVAPLLANVGLKNYVETKGIKWELGEERKLIPLDKDGNRLMDEKRTKFLTYDDVIEMGSTALQMKKQSNAGASGETEKKVIGTNEGANKGKFENPNRANTKEWLEKRKAENNAAA